MLNTLIDPVFRTELDDGPAALSIPQLLAAAAADRIRAFRALRPHQWQAWHCFLAQLGALALLRSGADCPPTEAGHWLQALRQLSADWPGDEPWQLVVDDWRQPAFLQVPVADGSRADYKTELRCSDALDTLVTAKNHDLKRAAASAAQADDWAYALINLQTTEGFLGAGNYGISRMNGGFSNRNFIGLRPRGGPGRHLLRDIEQLRRRRESIHDALDALYPLDEGLALVWLAPWEGRQSLSPQALDPYYIEICRRVRLRGEGAHLSARCANSKVARIDAKALSGHTGDPWAPVQIGDTTKALTLGARGFDYRLVNQLLGGGWRLPPLALAGAGEDASGAELVFSGFARGQGKTEGLHQRRLPLPARVARVIGRGEPSLGALARERVDEVDRLRRLLRNAVAILHAGGPGAAAGRVDLSALTEADRAHAAPWVARFEQHVDAHFFAPLWRAWEAQAGERDALRRDWLTGLIAHLRALLSEAGAATPRRGAWQRRSQVAAEGYLQAQLIKAHRWTAHPPTVTTEEPEHG